MVHDISISKTFLFTSLFALGAGLAGCTSVDTAAPEGSQSDSTEVKASDLEQPGMPDFLRAPHTRDQSLEKLESGYYYSQGDMGDDLSYGMYTYIDDSWTYTAVSVWNAEGSSISTSTDIGADGQTWVQSGDYDVLSDGSTAGDYFTSYLDSNKVGTIYMTEYTASLDGARYRSTIDRTDTESSPDCDYMSEWKDDFSASYQMCVRDDASWWSCDFTYAYINEYDVEGVTVAVQYVSEQVCNDSNTAFEPDYSYSDEMEWDYMTGDYTDVARMMCHEDSGAQRNFSYMNQTWYDENGVEIDGPTCGWSQDN